MRAGSKAENEVTALLGPKADAGSALTLEADSVPSSSSVVETRSAGGQSRPRDLDFDAGPQPGDTVAGHYRVLSVLGEGGMGRVYACENGRTGRRVALKWVPAVQAGGPDAIARFAREARVAGHVQHPNVIDVYDVVEEGPATFLVMELLEGESLGELLEKTPQLPVEVAVGILMEAMRGIGAAHEAGVVHRDLKPDNLFLCQGKGVRVKVVDFGISKRMGEAEMALTQTGAVVGTPYYMAPEQMRGRRDLDHRLDIYALGAILYEMLAGEQPYRADTLGALAIKVATEDPAPLSGYREDLPPGLAQVVQRAMSRTREDRYQDIASFAQALEPFGEVRFESPRPDSFSGEVKVALASSTSIPAVSVTASPVELAPAEPSAQKRPWLWPTLALALLLALGAAWWFGRDTTPTQVASPPPVAHTPTEPTHALEPEVPVVASPEPEMVEAAVEPVAGVATPEPAVDDTEPATTTEASPSHRHTSRHARADSTMDEVSEMGQDTEVIEPSMPTMQGVEHRAGELGVDDF